MVMRSCRSDGVLLRPLWPLSSLDAAFTRLGGAMIWAAHDSPAPGYRWSYILGVNLATNAPLFPGDLQQQGDTMVCWEVRASSDEIGPLKAFDTSHPLTLHTSALPKDPLDGPDPASVHCVAAPGGLVIMGEVSKWATLSRRRVSSLAVGADSDPITARITGAPGETVEVSYAYTAAGVEAAAVKRAACAFPTGVCEAVRHNDTDCHLVLTCHTGACACGS